MCCTRTLHMPSLVRNVAFTVRVTEVWQNSAELPPF